MFIFSTGRYAGTFIISILSKRGASILLVEFEVQMKMHWEKSNSKSK
jgi:hypothetical protein